MLNHSILDTAEDEMKKSVTHFQSELTKLRTGRAHAGALDHISVSYHGQNVPIQHVANITALDVKTLSITPWDRSMIPAIEKSILAANLGLNPLTGGQTIQIPFPPITGERRKELLKTAKTLHEEACVSVRTARRNANQSAKDAVKQKNMNEDEEKRMQDEIQKRTNRYIEQLDQILKQKELELSAL